MQGIINLNNNLRKGLTSPGQWYKTMKKDNVYFEPLITTYLEKAAYIAATLSSKVIHTAYFMMVAFADDDIIKNYFFSLTGNYFSISDFIYQLLGSKEDFFSVFPKKEFKEDKSSDNKDDEREVINTDGEVISYPYNSEENELVHLFTITELRDLPDKLKEQFKTAAGINYSDEDFENRFKISFYKSDYSSLDDLPVYSNDLGVALTDAINRCVQAGENVLDVPNLIYSLASTEGSSAQNFLSYLGIDPYDVTETLEYYFDIFPEYDENSTSASLPSNIADFCEILNTNYPKDIICDILGRNEEINTFWVTASRKSKKNAILTGPAGCGKTAIVEAITMSIVNGTAPKQFLDYTVISLNLTSMLAGTMYRGDFEQRAKDLVDYLMEKPKVILFIDEIHQIMGAGSTNSNEGFSFAGVLKPILARDDAIVIGATTTDEYEQFIARDSAFKRRFERIAIKEPKVSEVKAMVRKKVENLSKYHKVSISDDILDYIIIQAFCFNEGTANPDKTISLCDSAMAVAKTKNKRAVAKIDVDKVNALLLKRFKELPKAFKLSTAYHEAGHYVITRILPTLKYKSTIVVSIISTDEYEGVHSYEIDEKKLYNHTEQYFRETMIALMAGRAAEEFFTHSINSGARNDLARVTDMVRHMILVSGMDPDGSYLNLSLLGEDENNPTFITDKMKEYVITSTKKYVDDVYKETLALVKENKDAISRIAKSLVNRGMLDSSQLDKLFVGKSIIELPIESENDTKDKKTKKNVK